ncbi:hypothetical protein O6H91_02G051700 [Diphasiastrum complanatum]|uniref:Uncharacterized protein n=1 Tax=Diphasiastrum complanatum TaxID=34168 RepID=A0ACC2EF90_DIPCM|nr:hypothetical protein O6H91_02G051700 [Diphasiastrum complanatum]
MAALTFQSALCSKSQQNMQVYSRSLMQNAKSCPRFGVTSTYLRNHRSFSRLNISCMSQDNPDSGSTDDVPKPKSTSTTSPIAATPTPTSPAAPKKVSTNFSDIFAFSGPAPEKINGRLAMIGFVSALGVEVATGQSLLGQLDNGGLSWFIITAVVFTSASLIPLFQGVSVESKSQNFFSSKAETWNGRAAMVGLVALALTEYVKGSPLF